MKKAALIVCAILFLSGLLFAGDLLYRRAAFSGLQAKFASPTFAPATEWELSPLQPTEAKILQQKFTFLARGSQAVAFLSEDKKHVLKLFKQHKWRPGHILGYIPLSFNPYYKGYLLRQKKQDDVLRSCKTALDHVQADTGVLYGHLNPTPLDIPPVTLVDKGGKVWKIDLGRSCFLLQKKADLFYEHIDELMGLSQIEEAKSAITSVFKLIDRFVDLGVYENNAILRKNFGFIDNTAVQFDIGKFKFDAERVRDKGEIQVLTKNFRRWVGMHHPELEGHFDELLKVYAPL